MNGLTSGEGTLFNTYSSGPLPVVSQLQPHLWNLNLNPIYNHLYLVDSLSGLKRLSRKPPIIGQTVGAVPPVEN